MNSESLSLVLKIAYCLYRVSTKKQVDKTVDDIPVQRKACHEFAERTDGLSARNFAKKEYPVLRYRLMTVTLYRICVKRP